MLMVTDLTISTIPYLSEPDQALFCAQVNACPILVAAASV
jgi:hypothetical protein